MARPRTAQNIRIVTAFPGPLATHYFLHHLSRAWQAAGRRVEVGPCDSLPAETLGLLHIDRTRVEPRQLPRIETGGRLLNGRVRDISKRQVSRHRLTPESDWQGPVIVKTDANHHGNNEPGRRAGRLQRLAGRLPWRWTRRLPPSRYPILPSLGAVPDWVWRREDLVAERFLPERDGEGYVLRIWLFFGGRDINYRIVSPDPLVKSDRYLHLDASYDPPPAPIAAERQRLGFDFGKFDYVIHEGEAVLLDANSTPAWTGKNAERVSHLAGGLEGLLAERA